MLSSESIIEPFTGTLVVFQPMEIRTFWNGWLTWTRDMSVSLDLPKSELYAELASQLRASWPIDRPDCQHDKLRRTHLQLSAAAKLGWFLLAEGRRARPRR